MFGEILAQAFGDVFTNLGRVMVYKSKNGTSKSVEVVIKEPDCQYDLGDSQIVDQVAEVTLKASGIRPQIGDYICSKSVKYKIYTEPMLDASNNIWKFYAVAVEE